MKPLQLGQLSPMKDVTVRSSRHGDDYIYCDITGGLEDYAKSAGSIFRFEGVILILCNRGTISLCVNLTTITLSASKVFVFNMEDTVTHVESSEIGRAHV